MEKKTLHDLTLKSNFMFGAVMADEENCRRFLEIALGFSIERVALVLGEGSHTIFLSTCGRNEHEVPEALVKFLRFVHADLEESRQDFGDEFVKRLQDSIQRIRQSREMEERYMLFEELLRDERVAGVAEGKAEAILLVLEGLGDVPDPVREKILAVREPSVLDAMLKSAAKAASVEQFVREVRL